MRLLFIVLIIILLVALASFIFTNVGTNVTVTVGSTEYPDVPIFNVVLGAVLVGVLFTGVFAVAEGAKIRLENRRLRRQLHQLETEVNYLRTQPAGGVAPPPAAVEERRAALPAPAGDRAEEEPPSAPVYGTEAEAWPGDTDDDVYTGGRAV